MSKIQINYKSGNSMRIECEEFEVITNLLGERSCTWKNAKPDPMVLGVSEIESVWEL